MPKCETNITAGEHPTLTNLWVQCSVHFRGGWAPSVEWKHNDGDPATRGRGKVLNDEVQTVIAQNSSISSTLITAIVSTKGVYSISFKIYFSWPNGSTAVNAANTPSYEHTCIEKFGVEFNEGLQSTGLTKWSEVSRLNTPTIPSSAINTSVPENGKCK